MPYDPNLYFMGEETSLAARLWTHGWDIYHPNRSLVFHYWPRDYRRTHWDDVEGWADLDARSRRRVCDLLAGQQSRDGATPAPGDRYGLGCVRSLAEYQEFSGVDFARRQLAEYPPWEVELQRECQQAAARRRRNLW